MATVRGFEEYRKLQRKRIAKLKAGKRRGPITAAKFMAAQCRKLAPRNTGRVIGSIRRNKASVSVGGTNPETGFPYIHWINATPGTGLEVINLAARPTRFGKWPRKSTRNRNPTKWTKAMSYAQTKHTGTPGFFWIAEGETRKFYRSAMLRYTRNALMAGY